MNQAQIKRSRFFFLLPEKKKKTQQTVTVILQFACLFFFFSPFSHSFHPLPFPSLSYLHPTMLVLYETPAGYALFTLLDDGKLEKPDSIWKDFETPEQANKT